MPLWRIRSDGAGVAAAPARVLAVAAEAFASVASAPLGTPCPTLGAPGMRNTFAGNPDASVFNEMICASVLRESIPKLLRM